VTKLRAQGEDLMKKGRKERNDKKKGNKYIKNSYDEKRRDELNI